MRLHIATKSCNWHIRALARIGFRLLIAFQMELDGANYFPELVSVVRYLIFNIAAPAPLVPVCVAA